MCKESESGRFLHFYTDGTYYGKEEFHIKNVLVREQKRMSVLLNKENIYHNGYVENF